MHTLAISLSQLDILYQLLHHFSQEHEDVEVVKAIGPSWLSQITDQWMYHRHEAMDLKHRSSNEGYCHQ